MPRGRNGDAAHQRTAGRTIVRCATVVAAVAVAAAAAFSGGGPAKAAGASGDPSFVQHVADATADGVATLIVDVPAGVSTNSGDALVVSIATSAGSQVSSVTDSDGNAYGLAVVGAARSVAATIAVASDTNELDGDQKDTITIAVTDPADIVASVDEYDDVEGYDQTGDNSGAGQTASLSLTPTAAPELFVASIVSEGCAFGPDPDWDSASGDVGSRMSAPCTAGGAEDLNAVYQVENSASPATLEGTVDPSTSWAVAGVTLFAGQDPAYPASSASPKSTPCSGTAAAPVRHIILIVDENHSDFNIFEDSSDGKYTPVIQTLAAECGFAYDYRAATHDSLPNYLALTGAQGTPGTSASTPFTGKDCNPEGARAGVCTSADLSPPGGPSTTFPLSQPDLFSSVAAVRGGTYVSWMDAMDSTCSAATTSASNGEYVARHNPQLYYANVGRTRSGPTSACTGTDRVLPTSLPASYALPSLTVIVPDNCDNMTTASGCPAPIAGCSGEDANAVEYGDCWLGKEIDQLDQLKEYTDGSTVILFTFDEGDNGTGTRSDPGEGGNCWDNAAIVPVTAGDTAPWSDAADKSCLVPLVVMRQGLGSSHAYGSTATSPVTADISHYDTLYTLLKLLGASPSGYPAFATAGTDPGPTDYASLFGV
jgi:phosphatidylinositol-3-phosphatase